MPQIDGMKHEDSASYVWNVMREEVNAHELEENRLIELERHLRAAFWWGGASEPDTDDKPLTSCGRSPSDIFNIEIYIGLNKYII